MSNSIPQCVLAQQLIDQAKIEQQLGIADELHITHIGVSNPHATENRALLLKLAALLHDISDAKFNGGDDEKGSWLAREFLLNQGVKQEMVEHIQSIIKHVSYKGGFSQNQINSIEFQIVQDADRLDAIGAIGIARAFNYGGFKNRPIHKPEMPLQEYEDSKAYHKSDAPTINHFYEKLLKLKDLMNTPIGKEMAAERHDYMLRFLDRFYSEWDPGADR